MDKVQQIREKIEKLLDIKEETYYLNKESFNSGRRKALTQIKAFIDSLPEEPASESLEEAMEMSVSEEPLLEFFATGQPTIGAYGEDSLRNQFEAGAEWQKQQMMKDAVDAEVMYPASSSTLQIRYKLPKNTKLKYGDKVKIIIIEKYNKAGEN